MRYVFMEKHRGEYRLEKMCKVLRVSRSGYYAWRDREPSKRHKANSRLLEQIREVHKESRSTYGSPRVARRLREQGYGCGKNRVARIMKDHGIRAKIRKKYKKTTDSWHGYPVSPNLLLGAKRTDRLWASDITFIPTREGWLYVAVVMDVRTRKIIGLSMRHELTQELTVNALNEAVSRQKPFEGMIHHSDRGRQYATYAYQKLLSQYGMVSSMSRKGNCYDNAYAESFFATLKRELVHGKRYQSRGEARLSIFEYIQVFYNRIRKHSSLGYRSPEQYEQALCVI